MRIDEVKNHIGEEFVTEIGSYSAPITRGERIRVDSIETVESQRYSWSGRTGTTRKRYVRVTLLDNETGEPRRLAGNEAGDPVTHLIEAKQIGAPWADYWEHTSAERAQRKREQVAKNRLNKFLPRELWVGGGWSSWWGLKVDAVEHLADLLEQHVPGADEEG